MKKIRIKNLDELYAHLAEKAESLDVHGYDAVYMGVSYNGKETLLDWFFSHMKDIKEGCQDLLVAEAQYEAHYCAENDYVLISSHKVGFGILILITSVLHEYTYGEDIRSNIEKEVFLLDIE